jgi:lysozyme
MTVRGVDISVIQGTVDFNALAASGVQFVVIRCGVGNGGIDIDYTTNVAKATAAGLKVMAYHFVYPLPTTTAQPLRDPVKQAQYHFNAAQGQLAACDLEWPTQADWAKWGCTASQINQWALTYLAEYSRLSGQPMIVYTYPNFAQTVGLTSDFAQYPLWIASYEPTPAIPHPWTDWVLWQTTGGGGHLPNGAPVDTDLAKDLSPWGAPAVPVAQPQPIPPPVLIPIPPPAPVPAPAPPVQVAGASGIGGLISGVLNWINRFKGPFGS